MKVQNINSITYGARLSFNRNHANPPTLLDSFTRRVFYKCKQPIMYSGACGMASLSIFQVFSRIKKVKDSVKFPD